MAGLFGYDYTSKGMTSGFNPWYHYDNPRNTDGYYDYSQDRPQWENNGRAEDSRARVWRWTLDDLRAQGVQNPGDPANIDKVRAAYLNNVARLRRDIEAPENRARGITWANSGMAGYDKLLTAGPGQPGAPETVAPKPAAPLTVKAPPALSTPTPQNPAPAPAPGGAPQSGAPGDTNAFQRQYLTDPAMAYEYMIRQLGMNPDISTRFSKFMEQRFSPLLQASLAASDIGDNSNYLDHIDQLINNFGQAATTRGGDFFNQLRQQADAALGSQQGMDFLGGIGDQDAVSQYLNQLAVLRYAGANPMVQQSILDQLEAGQRAYNWEDFQSSGQAGKFLDWLRKQPYSRYIPTR